MQTIGPLAVRVKSLAPSDSIGKAAEAVRASTMGAAPVVEAGRLVGIITAATLGDALTYLGGERGTALKVSHLPLEHPVVLPDTFSPADALGFLEANDLEHAPVIDAGYGLLGM